MVSGAAVQPEGGPRYWTPTDRRIVDLEASLKKANLSAGHWRQMYDDLCEKLLELIPAEFLD